MPSTSSVVWPCSKCGASCPGGTLREDGIEADCVKCWTTTFHPWVNKKSEDGKEEQKTETASWVLNAPHERPQQSGDPDQHQD